MTLVETTYGWIEGDERASLKIFRGIPYGDNCDKNKRFLPPLPVKKWDGVKNCVSSGPIAVQSGGCIVRNEYLGPYFSGGCPERFGSLNEVQSENCLVLDLMTPGLDKKKRPVIVYIHGGGFSTGSGDIILGADKWVLEENIVLVGIHHRLNIFGYLYLGEFNEKYKKSGMAGIEDLILALEWIRDNILRFGGNPGNITLMGESGGAMKINILMMIKRARTLFHKVIIESGPLFVNYQTQQEGTQYTKKILDFLNLEEKDWEQLFDLSSDILLDASKILETTPLSFFPTEDGVDLQYDLNTVLDVIHDTERIPMLIGCSEDELAVFLLKDVLNITKQENEDNKMALMRILLGCKKGLIQVPNITEYNVKNIVEEFFDCNVKNDDFLHMYVKILSICGSFGLNAYCQSESRAESGYQNTFHYLVSYDTLNYSGLSGRYAWHTADLPLQMRIVLNKESEELSRIMSKSFAAFARNGNPSTITHYWPAYSREGKETMIFDSKCEVKSYPYKNIMKQLLEVSVDKDFLRWNKE